VKRHYQTVDYVFIRPVGCSHGEAKGAVPPSHAKPECPPLEEEIVQWPCPLNGDRLSVFYEKLSFLWAVLWASNMPKMLW